MVVVKPIGENQNGAKNFCIVCNEERLVICIHYIDGHKDIGSKCNCGIFNKSGRKINAKMKEERFKKKND